VLANKFAELFSGLDRAYGTYKVTTKKGAKHIGKATTIAEPVTIELWEKHLAGEQSIGIIPIRDDNRCVFGAIDIDIYDMDHSSILANIEELDLPLVLCKTKSGGAHLYCFVHEPVPARLMRKKLLEFAISLGYMDVEIFPKQDKLSSKTDIGNWINMPYFGSTRWALDGDGDLDPEQFIFVARNLMLSEDELAQTEPAINEDEFGGAPPCLKHLIATGFPKGSMNNALFSMGVFARKKFPDEWQDKVYEYNQKFMGPGTPAEVKAIIRSLQKNTYIYKCHDQPITNHCNKDECLKAKFGIGPQSLKDGGDKDDVKCLLDDVDRPVKCFEPPLGSNDEPQWQFGIHGMVLDVTLDMVLDQSKFYREYTKKFKRLLPSVKPGVWARKMNEVLEEAEMVQLPRDAGPEGQLWLHIENFCTGKLQARAEEELLLGKPWTDGSTTWFRSKDLMKYLEQQRFRDFKEAAVWAAIRRAKGLHKDISIKGIKVSLWGISAFAQQVEGFAMPVDEEETL
jgi:hypothetical protein